MSLTENMETLRGERLGAFLSSLDPENGTIIQEASLALCGNLEKSHICVRFTKRNELLKSLVCGKPGTDSPLILDDDNLLYLNRHWNMQNEIAQSLIRRMKEPPSDSSKIGKILDLLFNSKHGSDNHQRQAAEICAQYKLAVITGGPGTGKTSTIYKILLLLQSLAKEKESLRICLATPTGKAASRLNEALSEKAKEFSLDLSFKSLLATIPQEAQTVHRLLGLRPGFALARYSPQKPLPCDVFVLDEASMCGLPLMYRILRSLPEQCKLILVGDADQLSSVDEGSVFADICDSPMVKSRFLCRLITNFRVKENRPLVELAHKINTGEPNEVLAFLKNKQAGISFHPLDSPHLSPEHLETLSSHFDALAKTQDEASGLMALRETIILTPFRKTGIGTDSLNPAILNALLKRNVMEKGHGEYHRNQPLILTKNNPQLELYNGDMGFVMRTEDQRCKVVFPSGQGVKRISPHVLNGLETAFALTIHKSQGAEFRKVIVLIPPVQDDGERTGSMDELMTRELLYTAVTRARNEIEIWGSEEMIRLAVSRKTERLSGLKKML
jgi:exodeoxyribonuclease V alpha subunit